MRMQVSGLLQESMKDSFPNILSKVNYVVSYIIIIFHKLLSVQNKHDLNNKAVNKDLQSIPVRCKTMKYNEDHFYILN